MKVLFATSSVLNVAKINTNISFITIDMCFVVSLGNFGGFVVVNNFSVCWCNTLGVIL